MPLIQGYSRASIAENIARERHTRPDMPESRAVAIAFETARAAWRAKYPRGPYPAHLHGMRKPKGTSKSRNRARGARGNVAQVQRYADQVRRDLRSLGTDTGYVLFANIGPYDHNLYDVPLPMEEHPRVFRALYEAVDYAQAMKGWGKVKIARVDGTAVTGRSQLASTVVWKSWATAHGGWKA